MDKKIGQLLVLIPLVISCSDSQFVDGRSEILGINDTIINDSSIIEGHVYHVGGYNDLFAQGEFTVWIQEIDLFTETDIFGQYSLKTIPGTYRIKCEGIDNSWHRLIESATVSIGPNQKAHIDFYIGHKTE